MSINSRDLQPEFFCLASEKEMPHIGAYPFQQTSHPAMVTSTCAMCGQELYMASGASSLVRNPGPFVLRLIIHEEDEL